MPQQQIVRFEIKAQLAWRVFRSANNNWVAVCDPLKITLEGETFDELTQNINEGLQLLMTDLFETGEIGEFLRRQGWQSLVELQTIDPRHARFDVPYTIERANASGREVVYS